MKHCKIQKTRWKKKRSH